jgi:hypothetical protein
MGNGALMNDREIPIAKPSFRWHGSTSVAFAASGLALFLSACTNPLPTLSPTVTGGSSPSTTPSPSLSASVTPANAPNATCTGVSFFLDPALASGYTCAIVPADTSSITPHPQYLSITLQNYAISSAFPLVQISVIPAVDYAEIDPTRVPSLVEKLQDLAGGAMAPVYDSSVGANLPFLPDQEAMEVFFSNYNVTPFHNGNGIRYVTQLGFDAAPISNDLTIYTYQGLTSDGSSWVSVIVPVANSLLPANGNNPPGGGTWSDFFAIYEAYLTDTVNQLNTQDPNNFHPALSTLDALVTSISIAP